MLKTWNDMEDMEKEETDKCQELEKQVYQLFKTSEILFNPREIVLIGKGKNERID